MTYMTRSEVGRMAEAWERAVEGSVEAPLLVVRFTPAGLVAFMDLAHQSAVDVEVVPGAIPVTSRGFPVPSLTEVPCGRHCPPGCNGSGATRIEAREPAREPTGARTHPVAGT